MTKARKALIVCLSLTLALAGALIIYGETRPLKRTFYGSVKDLLPAEAEVPGWKVEYLPIADTPEMQAKVNELLNYDDAVYAVYTKGTERISIYIAYWTPGKMSQRLIAGHTPDVCWVGAGWKILEAKSGKAETLKTEIGRDISNVGEQKANVRDRTPEVGDQMSEFQNVSFSAFYAAAPAARVFSALKSQVSGFDIEDGERRLMARRGHVEQVEFWHLSGDSVISYGIGKPEWQMALMELGDAFQHRGEQLFVRVSASGQGEM